LLDGDLKSRPYVAGPELTIADITTLVAVDFMKVSKLTVPGELVDLRRWYALVSARPSASA
jgi:glutathione S-transferase